ncbi:MAG TPA: hypothetical protein VGW36_00110 [Pyrinomonadaceae bacterium]|nr:hypothetical protein [Pyrinomonadaceae bacterium]
MSLLQRGQLRFPVSALSEIAAAVPQRGQCLLPINIMLKQDGQAIVASRELQNWHNGASAELAAPQLGQLRVCACTGDILAVDAGC